jgi:pimeloyl-ACP methyl ester carboxylesterase
MGIAGKLIVCFALALMSASARAQQPAVDATKFYSALSCRLSKISGGQRNTAAIFERTRDLVNPLRLIRINTGVSDTQLEVITPRNTILIGYLGSVEDRFYWTPDDDLAIWSGNVSQRLLAKDIRPTPSPRFEVTFAGGASLLFQRDSNPDVIPEHIRTTARIVGNLSDREPLQFELATRDISFLPVPVGLNSAVAWTENDEFVRLGPDYGTSRKYLDVFEPATSEWIPFTRTALPHDTKLVLVRNNRTGIGLEVAIRWRDQGLDKIGIVTSGAREPRVIASDKHISEVLTSPERSRIYGFVDLFGRFRRIGTEGQRAGVAFWLSHLEKRQGLEQAYFLNDARFALVKAGNAVAGSEVQLLERRGDSVVVREVFCAGGSNVARVAESENSVLFVPKEMNGNKLIVYLHDGPFARVDKRGNWLIDLLLSSGNPVLAVNYTGSVGREPAANDRTSRVETFSNDVARAVAFGQREAGSGERSVVLVGHGFGSLVGFSALTSKMIQPAGFISVSGLVRYERLSSSAIQSSETPTFSDYGRIARETRAVLDPAKIREAHPQLDFLFVHGDKDDRSPHSDIAEFAPRLATTGAGRSALDVVREMDHSPYRRADYDQILKAVSDFLSRL